MKEIYDVKAFDDKDGIKLRVDFGAGPQYIKPKMDFFMEASITEKPHLNTLITDLDLSDEIKLVDREKRDVDGRLMTSILYKTLRSKKQIKTAYYGCERERALLNADIDEELQWMWKKGHIPANFLKSCLMFDIEVDPTGFAYWDDIPEKDRYQNRIYGIGCMDKNGIERFFVEEDERLLLRKFYAYTKNYTSLAGWNSGSFDIPVLIGRSQRLGLDLKWESIPHVDMMWAFAKWRKKTKELGDVVYKGLERVSMDYLDVGKIDVGGPEGIKRLWDEKDWLGLEVYCMQDVRLMYELYHKLSGIREMMDIELSKVQLGYLNPNKRYVSAFADNKFAQIAFEDGLAVPQMGKWINRDPDNLATKGAGGWVPEAKLGLHFNVVTIDYYSMYPAIYMTHNIGVNTVDWNDRFDDSLKTEELSYRPKPMALNAKFMSYLLETRKKYRDGRDAYEKGTPEYEELDIKQAAFKDLLVSANGVLEESKFRYKNQSIYNSSTKTGQIYLKLLKEAVEMLGWTVIGGDTDSTFATTPYSSVEEIIKNLPQAETFVYEYVKKKAIERWNLREDLYTMLPRCEQVSSHFFYIGKKNYLQKIVWDDGKFLSEPRFHAKGMPGVKYNTLPLLKEILQNIFKKVVFNVGLGESYVDAAVDYLLRVKDDLFSGRRDDWLTFAQGVNKLGGRLPHDRAAAILAERGLFEPGRIIRFIRRANQEIILPDYDKDYKVGYSTYKYYWEGAVASWMKRLLPEVAADSELGFRAAAPTKEIEW